MAGFKDFSDGAALPASDIDGYLMAQCVIQCTSGTRPSSPHEGMTIYETDTDLYKHYSGSAWVTLVQPGAWTTYTPVVKGAVSGSLTASLHASSTSRYCRVGRQISWHGYVRFSAAPAAAINGAFWLDLPVAADATVGWSIGIAEGYDNSANLICPGQAHLIGSGTMAMSYMAGGGPTGAVTNFSCKATENPWTWATDDSFTWSVEYEAAS